MSTWLRYSLIGTVLYAFFLLALMPAQFVVQYAPLPEGVHFSGVSGRIWHGQIAQARFEQHTWQVKWRLSPLSLLTLTPTISIESKQDKQLSGHGEIGYSLWTHTLYGHNLDLSFDMPWLTEIIAGQPFSLPLTLSGQLNVNFDECAWQENWFKKLTGQIHWQQARLDSPVGLIDLGTPKVQVHESNNKLVFDIDIQSDVLNFGGQATLAQNGQYDLEGELQPKDHFPEQMRSTLSMLSHANGDGVYPIAYRGKLDLATS